MLKLTAVATVLNVFFFGFGYANANVKQIAAPLQPPVVNTSATRATPTTHARAHTTSRSAHDDGHSADDDETLVGRWGARGWHAGVSSVGVF